MISSLITKIYLFINYMKKNNGKPNFTIVIASEASNTYKYKKRNILTGNAIILTNNVLNRLHS